MLAGFGAGLTLALLAVALADGIADIAIALADTTALPGAVAKLRNIDLRHGYH
jgi:hypothetical protein